MNHNAISTASHDAAITKADKADYIHPHASKPGRPTGDMPLPQVGAACGVDSAILEALPIPGSKLVGAWHYGESHVGETMKLMVQTPCDGLISYFVKIVPACVDAHDMMRAEYNSLHAIAAISPGLVPTAYSWGALAASYGRQQSVADSNSAENVEKAYFLLTSFRNIVRQPPSPGKLCAALVHMHIKSTSQEGMFGWQTPVYHGSTPQPPIWTKSWCDCFRTIIQSISDRELAKNGSWPAMEALRDVLLDKIIPRLLRPLQAGGRVLKPVLCHGDLWDGNTAEDENGDVFIFDAGVCYAHIEYDISDFRPIRRRLSHESYLQEYQKWVPPSEPVEDFDGRHILYSMRINLSLSAMQPSYKHRSVVFQDMRLLAIKYAYEDFLRLAAEHPDIRDGSRDEFGCIHVLDHLPPPPLSMLPLSNHGPPGNAWGRFGLNDELGMLNLLTSATVVEAAKEIKTGIKVCLDWGLEKPGVGLYGRPGLRHEMISRGPEDPERSVNDDIIEMNTQVSSQWDGFRHFGHLATHRYYNDRTQDDLTNSNVLGIDTWARAGHVQSRGILLDYATYAATHSISLDPFSSVSIPLKHLKAIVQAHDIVFRPGDILLIRTGFTKSFEALSPEAQLALGQRPRMDFAGIESTHATLAWLWKEQFAAVVSDCPSLERSPVTERDEAAGEVCLHQWLLPAWGMPIGELWDLEGLAKMCERLGRWTFWVGSGVLMVPGGVASPPNAVAIF